MLFWLPLGEVPVVSAMGRRTLFAYLLRSQVILLPPPPHTHPSQHCCARRSDSTAITTHHTHPPSERAPHLRNPLVLSARAKATFLAAAGFLAVRHAVDSPLSDAAMLGLLLAISLAATLLLSSAAVSEALWPVVLPSWASRFLSSTDPPAAPPPPLHRRLGWRFTLCAFLCLSFAFNALDTADGTLATAWQHTLG